MAQLYSNNIDTTLASALSDVATSATLADGSGLNAPTGGDYEVLTLVALGLYEIVHVTARTTNTITITRAQEGTTARNWASGTRVYTGLTKATIEGLQTVPVAGSSFVQSLDPGATPIGANAINIQKEREAATTLASGEGSVCIGRAKASGNWGVAIGWDATAEGVDCIALGMDSRAFGDYSVALTNGVALHDNAFSVGALPAVPPDSWAWPNSGAFVANLAMETVVLAEAVDLKTTATITCPVPTGMKFYADEVGLIVETANTVTVQPEVSFGITGDNAKLLAATATTGMDAAGKRQRFQTLLSAHAETSYTFTVAVAATATTLTARVYWRGFAVQDESA